MLAQSLHGHEKFPSSKNFKSGSVSKQILFQWSLDIYHRVKRPVPEVDHSHPSSVHVKGECVYVTLYFDWCALMVPREKLLQFKRVISLQNFIDCNLIVYYYCILNKNIYTTECI